MGTLFRSCGATGRRDWLSKLHGGEWDDGDFVSLLWSDRASRLVEQVTLG